MCADGYRPFMDLKAAVQHGALLAFKDVAAGSGEWEPFRQGRETVTPAPFYLVWDRPTFPDGTRPPWPYRIVALEISTGADASPDALARAGRDVQGGSDLFRRNCLPCHAVNLSAGTLGPELNVPANVTEYWHPDALRRYIKDPGTLRAGSKMPAFPDLSDDDVGRLIAYLTFMRSQKIGTAK